MIRKTQVRIAVFLSTLWGVMLSFIGGIIGVHAQEGVQKVTTAQTDSSATRLMKQQTASPRPAARLAGEQTASPRPAARLAGEQTASPRPAARLAGEQTVSPIPSALVILRQASSQAQLNEPTTLSLDALMSDKNEIELFQTWVANHGVTPTMEELTLFRLERISERLNNLEKQLGEKQ